MFLWSHMLLVAGMFGSGKVDLKGKCDLILSYPSLLDPCLEDICLNLSEHGKWTIDPYLKYFSVCEMSPSLARLISAAFVP